MRFLPLTLPLMFLSGCLSQAPQSDMATPAMPFEMPMDPGQISCADMGNPAALAAATDWAMGQARAAVMSGQRAAQPDRATMSAQIAAGCAGNSGTIRAALG